MLLEGALRHARTQTEFPKQRSGNGAGSNRIPEKSRCQKDCSPGSDA